ncbi:uncharacterized protein PSFLO_03629 [Pseudozyma flocculosa]|uniref:Uncharacterized protein n=1 Tax=Pseudozyma flocculosa TaxID=84751 RepID=A0A5C3F1J6_9BASI|nr:uncharacterized protein PSFLO_03629 [Pseudozyma flocculosa]
MRAGRLAGPSWEKSFFRRLLAARRSLLAATRAQSRTSEKWAGGRPAGQRQSAADPVKIFLQRARSEEADGLATPGRPPARLSGQAQVARKHTERKKAALNKAQAGNKQARAALNSAGPPAAWPTAWPGRHAAAAATAPRNCLAASPHHPLHQLLATLSIVPSPLPHLNLTYLHNVVLSWMLQLRPAYVSCLLLGVPCACENDGSMDKTRGDPVLSGATGLPSSPASLVPMRLIVGYKSCAARLHTPS